MRLLFTGAAPWANSGYGKPLRYLFPRLAAAGHEIAEAVFYGWAGATTDTDVGGATVRLFPSARDGYFNDIIEHHVASWGADAVISLQDVWILENWGKKGFVWCPWLPVDTHPVAPPIIKAIDGCHTPLVWADWAKRELQQHGWMQTRVIPLGVDLDIHKPKDKAEARRAARLPDDDRFIAGMVAANSSYPCRKSFPEVLLAWVDFLNRGNDGLLYIHTTITPKGRAGISLEEVLRSLSLPWSTLDDPDKERRAQAKVMFPSQHTIWCGAYSDESLANIYNALDLYLAPSMAEGFGIPIVEAQACGVPVVTLRNTAMTELTWNGVCLEPLQPTWEAEGGWRHIAPASSILDALECGKAGAFERRVPDEVARFAWDEVVARDFLPFLEELEDDICSTRKQTS
jgi:glycosyltransferase involved in cell wall biosynthesis